MSFLIPLIGTVNRTYTQGAVRHKCIKLRLVRLTVFKNLLLVNYLFLIDIVNAKLIGHNPNRISPIYI